jgi:hypothetical protein
MDDQFLRDLKTPPSPEFAGRLRATLRAVPASSTGNVAAATRFRKWLAAAASIAAVGFVFTLPPVQAAAEAVLDLFRVKQFAGVRFDTERLRSLEAGGLSPEAILGDLEPITPAQEPVEYATLEDAGAAADIRVRTPAWIPPGFARTEITASSEQMARITANTQTLQAVLDTLGLDDVELPQSLDGQVATVRVPPIVTQRFVNGDRNVLVLQAKSPEVSFPAEIELWRLAYAGLRVFGMERDEAYRMAVTIDWRSTLIVPVPSQALAYRPMNVAGNEGLLIEGVAHEEERPGGVLVWSAGDETYAVTGPVRGDELLEMAQTLY